tara:strand:+ start:822 stop:1646 length:825 start_codon:yes stop_codon:yes gene_type:complete
MRKINVRSPFYITTEDLPIIPPIAPQVIQVACGDTHNTGLDVGHVTYEFSTPNIGDVDIVITGNDVPVNFTVKWDGNSETTDFIGLDSFDSQLLAAGVTAGEIATGNPSTKNTTLTINKTSSFPELVQVIADAPLINDQYSLTFNCPAATVPTTPCGAGTSFQGGVSFPSVQNVTLGSDIGIVTFNFDAYGVPDKFIVEFDGVEVINTGYRGNTSEQVYLNNALAALGLPPENIISPPSGTASFNKTTATTTATVKVYAPISGTGWIFNLNCPT